MEVIFFLSSKTRDSSLFLLHLPPQMKPQRVLRLRKISIQYFKTITTQLRKKQKKFENLWREIVTIFLISASRYIECDYSSAIRVFRGDFYFFSSHVKPKSLERNLISAILFQIHVIDLEITIFARKTAPQIPRICRNLHI